MNLQNIVKKIKLVLVEFEYGNRDVKTLTSSYKRIISKLGIENQVDFISPVKSFPEIYSSRILPNSLSFSSKK